MTGFIQAYHGIPMRAYSSDSMLLQSAFKESSKMQKRSAFGMSATGCGEEPEENRADALRLKQLREMVRGLRGTDEQQQSAFEKASELYATKTTDSKDEKKLKKFIYNYKEVATKIQQAKNAQSAGQAEISAKRKVAEIKRKIANDDGDPEEMQLALTHARRMEMIARRKKHHLEIEETVVRTGKADEKKDRMEEAVKDMKNAMTAAEEEEVSRKEDAVFEERQAALEQAKEDYGTDERPASEELLASLNEAISEMGEEELRQLEETMEMLENMEVVDPHMSPEDLEKLRRKHRADEEKAIMKADMEYLKGLIKHLQETGDGSLMNPGSGTASNGLAAAFAAGGMPTLGTASFAPMADAVSVSVDVTA